MNKTAILHINTLSRVEEGSGAEVMLHALASHLQDRYQNHVIGFTKRHEYEGFHEKNSVRYYHIYNSRLSRRIQAPLSAVYNLSYKKIDPIVQKIQPKIAIVHNSYGWSSALYAYLGRSSIPVIQVLHDYRLMCIKATMTSAEGACSKRCLSCSLVRLSDKRGCLQTDAVVGVSRYILNKYEHEGYVDKYALKKVIYNSIELPPGYSITQEVRSIGFIGTLSAHKGIEDFLSISTEFPLYRFVVAGDGKPAYTEKLKRAYPNVTFLGRVDRDTFFHQVDVVVIPSKWEEPFGLTVLESLARGKLVLAYRHGGIPEIIRDGVDGWLFNDVHELKEFMRHISHVHCESASFNARKRAEEWPSLKIMADEYDSVIREVMTRKGL